MKRITAILLTLALCLCPLVALAEEERTLSLDECEAINHAVYEANTLEAIFSRHTSATYTFTTPFTPETNGANWIAPGVIFGIQGDVVEYDRDRVFYQMRRDKETGELSLFCGVNFDPNYDPSYRIVGRSEEEFLGDGHEHHTLGVERDGLLYLYDESDAVKSESETVALGLEYSGQVFTIELIADATTYDIVKLSVRMDEQVTWSVDVTYDEPEPLPSLILRAAFEHPSDNMVNLSYVVDPGTDHELSKVLTVPANSDASFIPPSESYVYFNDPDNFTIVPRDALSDYTCYIYTDPSDELLDRFGQAYYASLKDNDPDAFSLQVMSALVQSNSREALLGSADSVQLSLVYPEDEGMNFFMYFEDGLYFETGAGYNFLADAQGDWREEISDDGKTQITYYYYAMPDEERDAIRAGYFEVGPLDQEGTLKEKVVDTSTNDDGSLVLITRSEEGYGEGEVPEAYQDLPVEFVYIMDPETGVIRVLNERFVRGEERIEHCNGQIVCGGPRPEALEKLLAAGAALLDPDPDNFWTITVVYDAGTEAEQRYSAQLSKDALAYSYLRPGYVEQSDEQVEETHEYIIYAVPGEAQPE